MWQETTKPRSRTWNNRANLASGTHHTKTHFWKPDCVLLWISKQHQWFTRISCDWHLHSTYWASSDNYGCKRVLDCGCLLLVHGFLTCNCVTQSYSLVHIWYANMFLEQRQSICFFFKERGFPAPFLLKRGKKHHITVHRARANPK